MNLEEVAQRLAIEYVKNNTGKGTSLEEYASLYLEAYSSPPCFTLF